MKKISIEYQQNHFYDFGGCSDEGGVGGGGGGGGGGGMDGGEVNHPIYIFSFPQFSLNFFYGFQRKIA